MESVNTIIGIDCSTHPKKVGLACATLNGTQWNVEIAEPQTDEGKMVEKVTDWIMQASSNVLLSFDAPMGWPRTMSDALHGHKAGAPFSDDIDRDHFFYRKTDLFVRDTLKKNPLRVGASLIAATAHQALWLLGQLNKPDDVGEIKLILRSEELTTKLSAIEVYPAATRLALMNDNGKGELKLELLRERVQGIIGNITIEPPTDCMTDDARDAVICVFTGMLFLAGRCYEPEEAKGEAALDDDTLVREGWIWFPRGTSR